MARCEQRVWRRLFAGAITYAVVAAAPLSAQAVLPPYMELRVPKAPTVGFGESGAFIAYELHVTNFSAQPMTLKRVDVFSVNPPSSASRTSTSTSNDQGRTTEPMFSLSDTSLVQGTARVGQNSPVADRIRLAGGARAIVFIWVPVDSHSRLAAIRNRVTVDIGNGDSVRTQTLDGPSVPVSRVNLLVGPPLRGGPWLAANGPTNRSGHRRSIIPIDGTPSIAQRFATDWVKLNASDSTYSGDKLRNENYADEGNDALAVADGRVVATKDGIPENIPGSRAVPITLETVGGNHIIIDLGGGRHAFYAHLKPGSLRVKVGDRVKRGQVIALVGNTGNSTEPHLHFHISDANSPLGSEGVPFRIEAFAIIGHCRSANGSCVHEGPSKRHGEIPLDNTLVRFP